ncbi:MAG: M48 family metalloprotease [Ginsengibacter sp.]
MKFCLRILFFIPAIFLLFAHGNIYAQSNFFIPAQEDAVFSKVILNSLEKQYQQDISNLPVENKKDLVKVYKTRWDNIQEIFTDKDIYFEKDTRKYLEILKAEILQANPVLQNLTFQCYFLKSGIPNAAYLGEGLILVNMGLFSQLQNESQFAFILCHELAHYYLQHSENSIAKYVATLNSKEMQQELKNIKKLDYGKRKVVEDLVKGFTFDSRRHGRLHESEADSMAIVFMKNTHFDMSEAITTLALLDSIDETNLDMDSTLQKMFNFQGFPFRKKWLAKEDGLLGGHAILDKDESIEDSLKTHPDCQKRMQILEPVIEKYKNQSTINTRPGGQLKELADRFRYEVIDHYYASGNYSKSLFYTIQLLKQYPSDPYLVTQVGKIFNGLYEAYNNHTLGKVIDLPAPYLEKNYNLLLQFIQNLYKEDFTAIGYHYLSQYANQMQDYASFKSTYQMSTVNFKN